MAKPSSSQPFFSRSNVQSLVVIGSFVFAFRWSVAAPYEVPTPSMEPTIKVGDRLVGNHLAYRLRIPFTNWAPLEWGSPARGDIVIFKSQTDAVPTLVKRVIAVAGDTVAFRDGVLVINGQPQKLTDHNADRMILADATDHTELKSLFRESLTGHDHWVELDRWQQAPWTKHWPVNEAVYTVPAGYVFASGDNRDNSSDSRIWGPVPVSDIYGRATRILWSAWIPNGTWLPRVRLARWGQRLDVE